MKTVRILVIGILAFVTLGTGMALAEESDGFQFIPEWGVYARGDDIIWHAGVEWKLKEGTWVKFQGGNWVSDPHPPAVIVNIPKHQVHCPPGLAKKGCVPPGHQKKYKKHKKWGPPGHRKRGR
ncbi:MAG: hypothetical protein ACE5FK_03475 [Candidatus Methylomirabilia bacterium]